MNSNSFIYPYSTSKPLEVELLIVRKFEENSESMKHGEYWHISFIDRETGRAYTLTEKGCANKNIT